MRPSLILAAGLAGLALAGPAAAAGVLDRLKETGEIRLEVRQDAAPLSYTDESGESAGYSVLVCDAVATQLATAVGRDALTTT